MLVESRLSTNAINLTGNELDNVLRGNNGANVVVGGGGRDVMVGYAGNDVYLVDSANDGVFDFAGEGFDVVYTRSDYALGASSEVEILSTEHWAGTAAIDLYGNGFTNTLQGNAGANLLNGGGGNDYLYGFGGDDRFAFTTALNASTNVDVLADFDPADDMILLGQSVFSALPAGALAAGAFTVGSAATAADHRIVYNSDAGALYYDADGSGAGAAVLFAYVAPGLEDLSHLNFQVTP